MLNTADHPLAGAVFLLWALASSVVAAGGQGGVLSLLSRELRYSGTDFYLLGILFSH